MGSIIKPNTFASGETIIASDFNDNFDTIYNEFNGSISSANLATGAVTTTKIADDAVTAAKLADDAVVTANITDSAVTSEKLNATIACKAYRSGAFSITGAGGSEKIPLDAESFDLGSDWDTSNGRFVTPVTGYYQVNATVMAGAVNSNGILVTEVDVDGTAVLYANTGGTVNAQTMSCSVSDILYLTAGQFVELYADCSTTEAVATGAENTFMSIHFVGV